MFPLRPKFIITVACVGLLLASCLSSSKPSRERIQPKVRAETPVTPGVEKELLQSICGELGLRTLPSAADDAKVELPEETGVANPRFSCAGCPIDTSLAGEEGAAFILGSVIRGAFTAKGRDEAWVKMVGCESHSESFGGSYLLRRTEGGWKKIHFERGAVAKDCLKHPVALGAEGLVCESAWLGQGVRVSTLSAWLFRGGKVRQAELYRFGENLGSGFYPRGWIFDVRRLSWKFTSPRAGGAPVLETEFSFRGKLLEEADRGNFVDQPAQRLPAQAEHLKLRWIWKDGGFKMDPSSRKTSQRLREPLGTLGN